MRGYRCLHSRVCVRIHVRCLWAPLGLSACDWTCVSFAPAPCLVLLIWAGLASTSGCWWPRASLFLSKRSAKLPQEGAQEGRCFLTAVPGSSTQLLAWVTGAPVFCPPLTDTAQPCLTPGTGAQALVSCLIPHPSLGHFLPQPGQEPSGPYLWAQHPFHSRGPQPEASRSPGAALLRPWPLPQWKACRPHAEHLWTGPGH